MPFGFLDPILVGFVRLVMGCVILGFRHLSANNTDYLTKKNLISNSTVFFTESVDQLNKLQNETMKWKVEYKEKKVSNEGRYLKAREISRRCYGVLGFLFRRKQ